MSDSVTSPVGNSDPRANAAAGLHNANAPLPDLFADLLGKSSFKNDTLPRFDIGLARAMERAFEARPEVYEADHDPAPAEPSDDDVAELSETDDADPDGDEAPAENESDSQPQGDGEAAAQQASAGAVDASQLPFDIAAQATDKPGLTNQPNAASGVVLHEKTDGPTPGLARVLTNSGEVQAAAHKNANPNNGQGLAQNAAANGKPVVETGPSNAPVQQADAAAAKPDVNPAAATAKQGLTGDATAAAAASDGEMPAIDKPQFKGGPAQAQAQAAVAGDSDDFAASLEQHTMLRRAGAKFAAELHNMKLRLAAHRDAIKNAIAQSSAVSNGAQSQNAAGAGKPPLEIAINAAPPAPAAYDGPAARPAALFSAPVPGSLPGQAGNGATNMMIGETVGNGAEPSATAADRQAASANSTRGAVFRSVPPQLAYQPAEQVKVHIQQLVKSGADRIQIRLSPASLGRIEVALEMTPDKAVQAIVYAEKSETLDMLERDARVLQQAFEEAGMKFDSNSLTFKHGQSGNPDAELADNAASPQDGAPTDDEATDADTAEESDTPRRRQHDGRLDLEI